MSVVRPQPGSWPFQASPTRDLRCASCDVWIEHAEPHGMCDGCAALARMLFDMRQAELEAQAATPHPPLRIP